MPLEELSRWFVNRLRHSVVTGQLGLAVPTDSPDLVECIQGTVLLKKGLWWGVRQAIGLDNARKFLSSFTGLSELKISVDEERFRFTDDWFKLFESMALYRLKLHSDVSAGVEALISFLFGASSSPGSGNRLLQATFEWNDTKTLKAAVKQLFEVRFLYSKLIVVYSSALPDSILLLRIIQSGKIFRCVDTWSPRTEGTGRAGHSRREREGQDKILRGIEVNGNRRFRQRDLVEIGTCCL